MRRSPMWQRNLAINIILGLFILYFMAIFAVLGLVIDKLLGEIFPNMDPVQVFNGYLLLYFLADLLMRFFFDELPSMSMQPLLHLPVKRKKLVHYLLVRSALSFFNLFPLLLFIPFAIKVLPESHGWPSMAGWLLSVVCTILIVNYLATYFKRMVVSDMRIVAGFVGAVVGLGALEYFDLVELSVPSQLIWGAVLDMPVLSLAFAAGVAGVYMLNYRYISQNMYLDELVVKKKKQGGELKSLGYLENFGEMGRLMILELKLILRSKRPRTTLITAVAFTFYGLIFFTNDVYADMWPMLLFASIFVTGGFVLSYSQFFFAWESSYFDGVMTQRIDLRKYLKAKLVLVGTATFVAYLLSLLYGFLEIRFIFLNTAAALFNMGVTVFVIMWLSTNNNKRLNVNERASFNFQGSGATQFIAVVPALILPALIMFGFSYFDMPYIGIAVIGGLGLLGIIFHDFLIDVLLRRLQDRKYYMASGFRKEG